MIYETYDGKIVNLDMMTFMEITPDDSQAELFNFEEFLLQIRFPGRTHCSVVAFRGDKKDCIKEQDRIWKAIQDEVRYLTFVQEIPG